MLRRIKQIEQYLKKSYGELNEKEYTYEEFKNIGNYYRKMSEKKDRQYIDDITWNDIDMDEIFLKVNNTNSSVGEEYLYYLLRDNSATVDDIKERDRLANYFEGHEKERIKIGTQLFKVGYTKKISFSDYIENLFEAPKQSNLLHIFSMLFLVASLVYCIAVDAGLGIALVIAAVGFSITSYYKYKAKVENYFTCVKYVVKMINASQKICDYNITELQSYTDKMKNSIEILKPCVKGSFMLSDSKRVDGSLAEIFLDYIRMLTHIDLIIFNSIISEISDKTDEVYSLYENLGFLESMIAVSSYRKRLSYYSVPEFNEKSAGIDVKDIYHPMIEEPVTNSLATSKSILITGSNASGKSTFLKTMAINALLSQTIATSTSHSYKAPLFYIYSSMSPKDNLFNNESYYMAEIKFLKRILTASDNSDRKLLCFVDEVLRGTNTIERIAASSQILKSLARKQVLCFAATHDIELTNILRNYYSNYHFREEVVNNDISFNYILNEGPATTRNAIKLLGIMGYDKKIIEESDGMAKNFMTTNEWKILN